MTEYNAICDNIKCLAVGIKRNYRIMMPCEMCEMCTVCIVGNRIVIICIICNKWLMPVVMYGAGGSVSHIHSCE